jgi:hypothetical protein
MTAKNAIAGAIKRRANHLEVKPVGKNKFEVTHVGHPQLKNFVGVGDHVSSSDLDDFQADGYKVHEVE